MTGIIILDIEKREGLISWNVFYYSRHFDRIFIDAFALYIDVYSSIMKNSKCTENKSNKDLKKNNVLSLVRNVLK